MVQQDVALADERENVVVVGDLGPAPCGTAGTKGASFRSGRSRPYRLISRFSESGRPVR